MYDSQIPPTPPLEPPQPPQRRRLLLWVVGGLGALVLLQLIALGVFLAVPELRSQIRPFWARPAVAAPPESPQTAGQAAPARPLKIEESWDQPTTRWEQSVVRVADGAYEMRVDIPNYDSYGLMSAEGPVRNFDLAVDVRQVAGDPTAEYGVRFRQTGPSDYYMFSISGSGYYRLLQVKQGEYRSLTPWTFDGRIKTGPEAVNRLHVVAQGSSITGSVNDVQLATAKDDIDVGGQLTFGVTTFDKGGVVVRFDNIVGSAENIDIQENFGNPEAAEWSVGGASIVDGGYEITAGEGIQSWQQPLPNGSSNVGDFRLDVDATLVMTDTDEAAYGIIFGDGGSFDFYTLYLFPQGGIGLFRSEQSGQTFTLVPPVPFEEVKPGTDATNHITLEVRGQKISITLNGARLPDLELDQPIQGMVGLIVSGSATARFDNLVLEELSGSSNGTT
ncbi:MAG TPA: hypothetical protein VFU22_09460 [Roseiflexaceae bacterium]|nr:hypothetical protein [Roseiflexaceae bacterium]